MFVDQRPARSSRTTPLTLACAALTLPAIWVVPAHAQDTDDAADPAAVFLRQSPDDAWWTGPMLPNSAATLPRGHALIASYAFDQMEGDKSLCGSLTYLLYGLTDTPPVGAKPMFGAASGRGGLGRDRCRDGAGCRNRTRDLRFTKPSVGKLT